MRTPQRTRSKETGFSLVELLVTAFIMGVGLLGLAMLQTLSLRQNTGSRSLSTAILIAEGILDDAQARGRAARLFSQQGTAIPAGLLTPFNGAADIECNFAGRRLPDAQDGTAFFNVNVVPTVVAAPVAQVGGLVDLAVTVTWAEGADADGTPRQRQVVLNRRISYANN